MNRRCSLCKRLVLVWIWLELLSSDYGGFPAQASTIASDVSAIQNIRDALKIKLNWNSRDPCESNWQGVTCDNATNTIITELVLNNLQLSGNLPESIWDLNLRTLDLSFNPGLTGSIPAALGNLSNLVRLNLQSCGFTGTIPIEIGNLRSLTFLALNGNKLTGRIPSSIGLLKSLDWCDLSNNALEESLPVSSTNDIGFDNMTVIRHIHLNNNNLSGPLPKELSTLPNLIHLLLDNNNFSGTIPSEYGNFAKLKIMRLDNNKLEGPVPSALNQLFTLNELHLNSNLLNGTLPDFSLLQDLQLLRAGNIQDTPSGIPLWISEMSKLKTLELRDSKLLGSIPSSLLALPNLEAAYLDRNRLNGKLDLTKASRFLDVVSLERNNISSLGFVPMTLKLKLSGNPVCTSNSSRGACGNAVEPIYVPPSIACNTTCKDRKTASPVTCFCAFPLICTVQFITPAFSAITQERMQFVIQNFSTAFNISQDQIWIGSVNFTSEHRLVVNVLIFPPANNSYLESSLISNIIFQLSTQMVRLPDFGPLLLTSTNQPQTAPWQKVKHIRYVFIVTVCVCVGVSAVIASLCILFCMLKKKQKVKTEESGNVYGAYSGFSSIVSEIAPNFKGCRWFTLEEMKKASDNFSSSKLLGVGGYGKVYKGKLQTGELVAIKRAEKESLQGVAEFGTEIELFSRLHHKNLVNLIGFCTDDGEQMLVYEFMPNRTLRDHLQEHSSLLDWKTRLSIALGSAKGLEYLHELADPPIIHRDIKSSNILLGENLVAKVADLGLSKLAPTCKDGKLYTITQVKGTLGYLDPEYYAYQQLSDKSDVYSFGVVLIEIVTGRQPIDNGRFIVREIKDAFAKEGVGCFRSFLDGGLMEELITSYELVRYFRLALSCVEDCSKDRPRMNEVVKELEEMFKTRQQEQQDEEDEEEQGEIIKTQQQEEQDEEDEAGRLSFRQLDETNGLSDPSYAKFDVWSSEGPDVSFQAFSFSTQEGGGPGVYSMKQA